IENWSKNVFNLNTKRALVYKDATMRWLNGNMGSSRTMLYPCSVLLEPGAHADSLGVVFAGQGQNQDTGSKVIHAAPHTSSIIRSKSISKSGGISTYRGLVRVADNATDTISKVQCDALLLDSESVNKTYPYMKVDNGESIIAHEATVAKISEEQLYYLTSRGLTSEQALKLIVTGFIEPVIKALPLEYAVELNKLIELEIEGM
ncbi:TPA: Fe-S cluster assembly protein SufB, partial [Candidatus Woesearchaeota archaeon]|nr:Fe-S cluster assembly protein SufB [Candidatus Woesearchaeota archaeon]